MNERIFKTPITGLITIDFYKEVLEEAGKRLMMITGEA